MAVCPLEFRYGRQKMKHIFSEETRLQYILDVEAALAEADARLGIISSDHASMIRKSANTKIVSLTRVRDLDSQINHEITAIVRTLAEQSGEGGKYVHLGATSNDILDTSAALQIRDALRIIIEGLLSLRNALAELADKHRDTIMIGRTHGQFALPITFGLKMAIYSLEIHRHIERVHQLMHRICVGKMSGAVGTGAGLGPKALEIQKNVMDHLQIGIEEGPSQVVGRDRYVELVAVLANIATSIEKIATEIRNLQRSEISEVSEAFDVKRQVGSSTMAHKRNPVTAENICSLARIVRGFMTPAFESAILWHERDLTNSAAERFIIPHSFIILDDILAKTDKLMRTLVVNKERMRKNLESAGPTIMAESVIIRLVDKGMGRQEAHELLRTCAIECVDAGKDFKCTLKAENVISQALCDDEIEEALRPESYLGTTGKTIDNILAKYK
ncbi:MAG TPA: adenylosuccinate lyase [Thermoplasmata archaeon]|nr:adenylosuccinate lyase [Thermoplasmata archaeon]